MRTIIAGSRKGFNSNDVKIATALCGFDITEVVSGTARGVDRLGEEWASLNNIPVKKFPADWNGLGKKAGYVRNEQMAEYADALVALWDGNSRGTKHMIDTAKRKGLRVHVYVYSDD